VARGAPPALAVVVVAASVLAAGIASAVSLGGGAALVRAVSPAPTAGPLGSVSTLSGAAGRATPAAASPSPLGPAPSESAAAPAPPPVPALGEPVQADVLVRTSEPLPPDLLAQLVATTGATKSLGLATAVVAVGQGQTLAAAADLSALRGWTVTPTANSDPVWQRVAGGEVAMAHVVGEANGVPLGATVPLGGPAGPLPLRVGAFATTGIPGVGVVVAPELGARLGLTPATAVLLAGGPRDPAVAAAVAGKVLGARGTAVPVRTVAAPAGRWTTPAAGPVTSPFGERVNPFTGALALHAGIDIGAPLGAPVYAMSDGVVLYSGAAVGFGQQIVLQHDGGITTVYGHMSQLLVRGGRVQAGQPIALVGNEGESTGPHLHAEVRIDGAPTDPLAWLSRQGVPLR